MMLIVAAAVPALARIVVAPILRATMVAVVPLACTSATDASSLTHVIDAPLSALPAASVTVAETACDAPMATKVNAELEIPTFAAGPG